VLTNEMLQHGADYTPYEGLALRGWPVRTIVRGKTIVKDAKLTGSLGYGTYLKRDRSSLTR